MLFKAYIEFIVLFQICIFSGLPLLNFRQNTHTHTIFQNEARRSFVALEQRVEKWDIKWISEAGYLMVLCGLLLSRWRLWTLQECGDGPDGIAQTNPNSKELQSPPNEIQHQSDIISSCHITMEISKRTETEPRISHNRVLYFKVSSFYRHELGIQGDLFVFFFLRKKNARPLSATSLHL